MQPLVFALDHIVLTVGNIDATVAFYRDVMGMQAQKFTPTDGSTRWALTFGSQKSICIRPGPSLSRRRHGPRREVLTFVFYRRSSFQTGLRICAPMQSS